MHDAESLQRHYTALTDDALREALGAGPDAYQPPAWAELTRVAAGRGLRYVSDHRWRPVTPVARRQTRAAAHCRTFRYASVCLPAPSSSF